MSHILKLSVLSLLVLAACGQTEQDKVNIESAQPPAHAAIAPIKSNEMVVTYKIGDNPPRDWTIVPELSPDTMILECAVGETVPVTFTTDIETRTIPMRIEQDSIMFDIVVNDDIVALTELKCIDEIIRYKGDYSADRATAGDYAADISPVLQTYFNADAPGSILSITEGDEVLYEIAIGLDKLEETTERRVDEAFDIASVSKEFTAISILQLAEQGLLTIGDPISKYFDDLPNGDEITLHHLLTHTHGLPQIRNAEDYDDSVRRELDVALDHIRAQDILFAPGERYSYGNTAYYLLAVIAEQVSGLDRKAYVQQNLFAPAGMTESSFIADDPKSLRRVKAYNEAEGEFVLRTFEYFFGNEAGAGDIISTINDIRRWQRAVSDGTLISAETFALATAPKVLNDGTEIARGYGFFRGQLNGEIVIYNSGDFFTHTRHFYMPSRDLSIILNLNGTPQYDGGQSSIVWMQIVGKVFNTQMVELFDNVIDLNEL